jgi:hypothetical protein
MNTEPISNHCPKCHAPLPASAPEGLCRKCLLAAVATPTEAGQPPNAGATVPPSLEAVAGQRFRSDLVWATTLVHQAVQALASESHSSGKHEQFAALKPWLLGEVPSLSQAEAARQLGMSEGAVKVAIHRLRKRFREQVKTEIGQTVGDPAQVQDELRYLIEVLSQS